MNRTKKWIEILSILNGIKLKNDKKNDLRTSKLKKHLLQIECFQRCLSTENSNSVFTLKLNDCAEYTSRNEVMEPTTSNSYSQPIVPKPYPQPGRFYQACY